VEFCAGITALSADPGVFVAHVPGMKVLHSFRLSHCLLTQPCSGPVQPLRTSATRPT
jgi:hypothetical protein